MGYAGQDYGSNGAYSMANTGAVGNPGSSLGALTTAHASGVIVIGALLALIAIRMGFRGVSVGGASIKVG